MNEDLSHVAEETVDWILSPNNAQKNNLETFSLGLTPEGKAVLYAVLNVLRPILKYQQVGQAYLPYSNLSRPTLLKLAKLGIDRIAA